ncbi:type II toxin-antitoxin system VapC family toxin [Microlunatus elymi]|uniref:Ribonuclease VapC n=1 Tax=Microlunatus elymi TaxID=2596828 RepID=A0A516Q075_9ACTN|nr:type II toxin-antitoxin system VapC family toxin [Microlunatus elymi]QDP96836.1 type II toxin-antitoxin system VapC family toxin [Microlunatus elymi]
MSYLLDTNVVSELRKSPTRIDANVAAWAAQLDIEQQCLSAITVFEVELGIRQLERRDTVQAAILWRWFDVAVLDAFDGRILPVDKDVARLASRLHVPDPRPERDGFIAATALAHGLTLATRNVTDFDPTGAAVFDPWAR